MRQDLANLVFPFPAGSGLDPAARDDFWKVIGELREKRSTAILISTHLFDEAERCDSLILLHKGVRVAEGAPEDL